MTNVGLLFPVKLCRSRFTLDNEIKLSLSTKPLCYYISYKVRNWSSEIRIPKYRFLQVCTFLYSGNKQWITDSISAKDKSWLQMPS